MMTIAEYRPSIGQALGKLNVLVELQQINLINLRSAESHLAQSRHAMRHTKGQLANYRVRIADAFYRNSERDDENRP